MLVLMRNTMAPTVYWSHSGPNYEKYEGRWFKGF